MPAHQRRQPPRVISDNPNESDHRAGRPPPPGYMGLIARHLFGAWTIAHICNCPITQVRYTLYNGAALSALRFLLIHFIASRPANLDIDDSTWSAPPPSLFVNMSRVWPSKSYSHLHVGEGWKQTDTSFPITLYVGSVSLANGRGCARLARAWGGWVWGDLLVWGGWAPTWGVGPAGLLVRALCKY